MWVFSDTKVLILCKCLVCLVCVVYFSFQIVSNFNILKTDTFSAWWVILVFS